MNALEAAGLWIGVLTLFLLYLSFRVGPARRRAGVDLGDGGDPALIRAVRTHANFAEYAPAAMAALLAMALLGSSPLATQIFGATFFFARLAHFAGLGLDAWRQGRFVGTLGTYLWLAAAGVYLVLLAIW